MVKCRIFTIISRPDVGETTVTEKVLLSGQAIQTAGTIKDRDPNQHAESDWMEVGKQHGVSTTTSVMRFPYHDCLVNLLDIPRYENFSEDVYRTLTVVDCYLMVIDVAKDVEDRTRRLMEVTRPCDTLVLTFMNKPDRDIRDPMKLLDEIEDKLKVGCTSVTWSIGCGRLFKSVYHLHKDETYLYQTGKSHTIQEMHVIKGLDNLGLDTVVSEGPAQRLRDELELVQGAPGELDHKLSFASEITPVFFSAALGSFGVDHMLNGLIEWAPMPMPCKTGTRVVEASKEKSTSFVFKIQTDMDPKYRSRVTFMRVVPGKYERGMRIRRAHIDKNVIVSDAFTLMTGGRFHVEETYPGDTLGLYNHGTIQISDTLTQGEMMKFTGIPNFTLESLRYVCLKDPLKQGQLLRGPVQLSEENAVQVFCPVADNGLIVDAVSVLQFDVMVSCLKSEYNIETIYESVNVTTARQIECSGVKRFEEFKRKNKIQLALDGSDDLAYITPAMVNLNLIRKRHPDVQFRKMREY